jgi:glutamine---fructose-6-phosphate transaminase (isomerizing)
MCGIFGYVGQRDDSPQLVLAGLKKLEYRGYDSWGIAARANDGGGLARLLLEKHVGKIGVSSTALPGSRAALGHTRWATHGGVTEANAHPHLDCQGRLAVIHNGIIENHADLRRELQATGRHTFLSQTDTEVVSHLLEDELRGVEETSPAETPLGDSSPTRRGSGHADANAASVESLREIGGSAAAGTPLAIKSTEATPLAINSPKATALAIKSTDGTPLGDSSPTRRGSGHADANPASVEALREVGGSAAAGTPLAIKSTEGSPVAINSLEGTPLGDESPIACERLVQALMNVFRRLDGLNAISVLDPHSQCIAAAKNGSPLVLGWGEDGNFLASDSSALLEHTRKLTFLEDGQAALIGTDFVNVYQVDTAQQVAEARTWDITWREETEGLDGYPNYMVKEINEQPLVLRRLAAERGAEAQLLADEIQQASTVHFVGCGSAAHAARCGEYLFSRIASRQANCVVGSEFGYLADFLDARSLVVALSQSGETIDLLESMKAASKRGAKLAALVNVEGSSLYRMVDHPILLSAGPERCVLATKSFSAKLGVLLMAAYAARGRLDEGRALVERAADEIQAFLTDGRLDQVRALAQRIATCEHLYVIGRGPSYPMALEAALKIKEVSYIHAEGFAGGELKHGVIALIEPGTPCIVLAPKDETFSSIVLGAEEIKARGGFIIGVSPSASDAWDEHIRVADVGEAASIVNAVPPQVLAYELALQRGLDPDKPRNLAKSVTVR